MHMVRDAAVISMLAAAGATLLNVVKEQQHLTLVGVTNICPRAVLPSFAQVQACFIKGRVWCACTCAALTCGTHGGAERSAADALMHL